MRPFIPAWLDEAGLSPSEMRVLIHLMRSADKKGIAWPSYDRITAITGMGRMTVRRAIGELEKRELIEKLPKPFAGSCRYKVLPIVPNESKKESPNSTTSDTIEEPPIVPSQNCNSPISIPPIVPPRIQEGNPLKVIQRRLPIADALPFQSDLFQSTWKDWIKFRKEKKSPLTETTIERQLKMLGSLGEKLAIECIERSLQNGWTGLFPEKTKPTNRPTNEPLKYQQNGFKPRPLD